MKDDIIKQMAITESLTQQHKGTKKAMLDIENSECIQCQQNDNSRVQSMFHIYNFTIEKSWELCAPSHRQSCNFWNIININVMENNFLFKPNRNLEQLWGVGNILILTNLMIKWVLKMRCRFSVKVKFLAFTCGFTVW